AQACQVFADARNSGALELLLCTPLPAAEIVEGHRRALKIMFERPILILLIVEFVVIAGHIVFSPGGVVVMPIAAWCLSMLAMDLYAAGEYGMWLGLASKNSTQALTKTMLYVLVLPAFSAVCCTWVV